MHLKNINVGNTANLFFFFFLYLLPEVQNEQLHIRPQAPKKTNALVRLEKVKIEGTIMLLSSRERKMKI